MTTIHIYTYSNMKIRDIVKILDAEVVLGENRLDDEVNKAFASDFMSDVLAQNESPLLISGLCNMQTIRTCEVVGIEYVVLSRDKRPTEEMLELAREENMVLLVCRYSLFKTCGLLYNAGLIPLY